MKLELTKAWNNVHNYNKSFDWLHNWSDMCMNTEHESSDDV